LNRPRFESLVTGITLMSIEADRHSLELLIVELLSERAPDVTICPSEVARAASVDAWRILMPAVRMAAARLASEGTIVITQGGRPITPETTWRGPVRLGRGDAWDRRELLEAGTSRAPYPLD
jgi:hypothetical protein